MSQGTSSEFDDEFAGVAGTEEHVMGPGTLHRDLLRMLIR